ncbi:PIN domain-containing protein [bacterium]|nr:PIN domain-containing protein [bacterium]
MNLLLDTPALIWFLALDNALPNPIKTMIESIHKQACISIASLLEISIKLSLGKLVLGISLKEFFDLIQKSGIDIMQITQEHLIQLHKIPYYHRDPFDRLIIAQCIAENISITSIETASGNTPLT